MEELYKRMRRSVGLMARVVKGRKLPIGAEGPILWVGWSNGDPWKRPAFDEVRVGLDLGGGRLSYTSARNVEVLDGFTYHRQGGGEGENE